MDEKKTERMWLLLVAAVCGAVVMALELLGARMLSVGFGGSVDVWAAMISVTLFSLAVGYFAGGRLADRFPRSSILYVALIAVALMIAACPHLQFVMRRAYHAFGLRMGALASSIIIFSAPLLLLGIVSPFVIRLLAREAGSAGRVAGSVYAISTLGSVAGTLGTGLWLIPNAGISTGFAIAAATLGVTGAAGLLLNRRRAGLATLLVPAAILLVPASPGRAGSTYVAPDGETVRIEAVRESSYGHMVVLTKNRYRLLAVNGIVQTGFPLDFDRLGKGHFLLTHYYQELVPYMVDDPAAARVLVIGLAGGMTAGILAGYDMTVDCVDIDGAMIELARERFGFKGHAVTADGRRFLEDCGERGDRYDFCVMDTYSGDVFPAQLASREAFRAARRVLTPGGVLVINFIGAPGGAAFDCMHATLSGEFGHVRAIRGEDSSDVQTITFLASDRAIAFNKAWLDHLGAAPGTDPVSEAIARLTVTPRRPHAPVLTDDHNPIDFIRAAEAIRWRERSLENIGEQAVF